MQSFKPPTQNELIAGTAREVLEVAPSLVWYIRRHMRKHRQGLSIPQFRALVKVRNEPAASVSAVAEHLGASLPTASRIVANLVKQGFLTRTSGDSDRRLVALTLSERGRAVIDAAHAATQAQMEADLAGLSGEDCERVRQAMGLLGTLFDSLGFRAGPEEMTPAVHPGVEAGRQAAAYSDRDGS